MLTVNDFKTERLPTWCPGCVLPGTLLHGNPSVRKIDDFKVGDKVLGSDGKYHEVTKTYTHRHQGLLYRVTSKCFGDTVLTPEHPTLVVKRENKHKHNKLFPIVWEMTENLKKGDYVVYPIPTSVEKLNEVVLPWKKLGKDTRSKTIPSTVELSEEFLYLAGLYIAEGYVHSREIVFSFHNKEQEYVDSVIVAMKNIFGLGGKVKEDQETHSIDVFFNSSLLARVFEDWFGKLAEFKKIPHFLMLVDPEKQKSLLRGLFNGDGHIRWDKHRAVYKTASSVLSEQVKLLLLRQGIIPSITEYKAYQNHLVSYAVHIVGPRDFGLFAKIYGRDFKFEDRGRYSSLKINDFILLPIRKIEAFDYDGPVLNLEVADVNSYVTKSATLHNCGDYGIWAALKNALIELNLGPEKAAVVFDIGCNSNMYDATRLTSFEGLHGRTLPVAEGIRSANSNLPVICIAGDGGCLGEGGNHFIHAARRNYDITLLLFDNQVYGLTTGQTSPTTPLLTKTKSTPEGSIEYPLNPLSLALSTDASFIARGFAGDIPNLTKLIVKAITHKGFSVLDILQPCVSFNHLMTYQWYRDRVYSLPEGYKTDNKLNAYGTMLEFPDDIISKPVEGKKIPLGVFYEMNRPVYEEEYFVHSKTPKTKPILSQSIENIEIEPLVEEFT